MIGEHATISHIQSACYAMTGERQRNMNKQICAPWEIEITKNIYEEALAKKEATMQVTYNGFTGVLVKLEPEDLRAFGVKDHIYNLSIYDSEKNVTHSFTGVKLEDVKFLAGAVTFGG